MSSGITEQVSSLTYYFYSNLCFFFYFFKLIRLTNPNPPWDIQRVKWVRGIIFVQMKLFFKISHSDSLVPKKSQLFFFLIHHTQQYY